MQSVKKGKGGKAAEHRQAKKQKRADTDLLPLDPGAVPSSNAHSYDSLFEGSLSTDEDKGKAKKRKAVRAKKEGYESSSDAGEGRRPSNKSAKKGSSSLKQRPKAAPKLAVLDLAAVFEVGGGKYVRQWKTCQSMSTVQPCRHCVSRQSGDTCRFLGVRAFPVLVEGNHVRLLVQEGQDKIPIFVSDSTSDEKPVLPDHYDLNRGMDETSRTQLMITSASSLLAIFEGGLQHARLPKCIRRARELQIRALCDFCSTGLFSASFLCTRCGGEYCLECREAMDKITQKERSQKQLCFCVADKFGNTKDRLHSTAQLIPITRFSTEELLEEVEAMRAVLPPSCSQEQCTEEQTDCDSRRQPDQTTEATSNQSNPPLLAIPSLPLAVEDKATLDEERFLATWEKGEPLVVKNVETRQTWDPTAFIQKYGEMECEIVRCDAQPPSMTKSEVMTKLKVNPSFFHKWAKQVQVRQFFESFGKPVEERSTMFGQGIWKLKDWPPAAEFCTSFPDIYQDFNLAVPMPDYTRRDGCKNLSSLFPKNANGPDLGPKMYNAWPGEHSVGKKGTTCLHMDIADAVNILLYTAPMENPEQAAQWDIFRAEDANAIRDFLREKHPKHTLHGDPIHTQVHYLDDEALQQLYREKGVCSWRIMQRTGEAVFIPAGCAHQVCNLTDCIKVAVDFLSPQNVARCFQLTEEFRGLTVEGRKSWKEDILQLKAQLWYAWKACRAIGPKPDVVEHKREVQRRAAEAEERRTEAEEKRAKLGEYRARGRAGRGKKESSLPPQEVYIPRPTSRRKKASDEPGEKEGEQGESGADRGGAEEQAGQSVPVGLQDKEMASGGQAMVASSDVGNRTLGRDADEEGLGVNEGKRGAHFPIPFMPPIVIESEESTKTWNSARRLS